ncbi:MAG: metallophosphoesterase [Christensenellales bacterium]
MIKRAASLLMPILLGKVPKNIPLLYPFYIAGQLTTAQDELYLPGLPGAYDGFTVGYASDIHYGPLFHREEAERLYDALLDLKTDLLVLGGDYGNKLENAIALFELFPPFPRELIVLAAIGNHDYGKRGESIQPLLNIMQTKNVISLINQTWKITRETATLAVSIPDDILCGTPDLNALKTQTAGAGFVMFAPHSPDLLPEAEKAGFRFDLALCGHTHGGQITLFGRSLHSSSRYGDRFRSGWLKQGDALVLVSEGVGTSILPMRIGTRSQIHRLILRNKL